MLMEKVVLGITLAAPIGPVSLEMIKRGLSRGFLSAFVIRLGGVIGNALCLIAAYFGLGLIMNSDLTMGVCSLGGSIVLLYLGIKSLLDKRIHHFSADQDASCFSITNGLMTGFILSISSPIGIVFWLSIFAASLDQTQSAHWLGLLQNFTIIAGVLIWGLFLSGLLEMGKRFFNQKLINVITTIAGLMLIGFGLKFGYKAISLLA